jgi:hypothetical protein
MNIEIVKLAISLILLISAFKLAKINKNLLQKYYINQTLGNFQNLQLFIIENDLIDTMRERLWHNKTRKDF